MQTNSQILFGTQPGKSASGSPSVLTLLLRLGTVFLARPLGLLLGVVPGVALSFLFRPPGVIDIFTIDVSTSPAVSTGSC